MSFHIATFKGTAPALYKVMYTLLISYTLYHRRLTQLPLTRSGHSSFVFSNTLVEKRIMHWICASWLFGNYVYEVQQPYLLVLRHTCCK